MDLTKLAEADWSKPLQPLFAHRARLLPIDALSLATAELDMDGNRHDTGWVHAWTGANVDFSAAEAQATSMSIDQLIAAHIGGSDRLPSIEMSVNDRGEPGRPVSYDAKGARLPLEADPLKVWQRIFGPSAAPNPLTQGHRKALDFAWNADGAEAPTLAQDAATATDVTAGVDKTCYDAYIKKGQLERVCTKACPAKGTDSFRDNSFTNAADYTMLTTGKSCSQDAASCAASSYVVAGKPTESLLWLKLDAKATHGCGDKIPPKSAELDAALTDLVKAWITAGAKKR